MAVYLLHFTHPLVRSNGEVVQHYLGYVEDGQMLRRLEQHRRGRHTAPVVKAAIANNSDLRLGAYWQGQTRNDERRRKQNGHLRRHCAICRAEDALRAIPVLEP